MTFRFGSSITIGYDLISQSLYTARIFFLIREANRVSEEKSELKRGYGTERPRERFLEEKVVPNLSFKERQPVVLSTSSFKTKTSIGPCGYQREQSM